MRSDQPPIPPNTHPRDPLHSHQPASIDNPAFQGSRSEEVLLDPPAPSQGTPVCPEIFLLPEIDPFSTLRSHPSSIPNIPRTNMHYPLFPLGTPSQPLGTWQQPYVGQPPTLSPLPATNVSRHDLQQSTSLPHTSLGPHPQSQELIDWALFDSLLRAGPSSRPPPEATTASPHLESVDDSGPQVTSLPPNAVRGIDLVSPRPAEGETTVQVRRDTLVILNFDMQILSRGSATYDGLKIPSTPSVNRKGCEAGKKLLHIQIRVLGATTKALYRTLCHKCKERAGDKDAFPDFRARSNIVVPQKNGRLVVAFVLACCSKHREPQDSEYCLEVVLNGGTDQNIPFVEYELPYSFVVVTRLPPRTRNQAEDVDGVDGVVPPPSKLPRTDSGRVSRVENPVSQGAGPSGLDASGDSRGPTSNTSPGASEPLTAVDNHHPSSPAEAPESSYLLHKAVNAASDEEAVDGRDLVIEGVFPDRGPTTGGPKICILGSNFPTDQMPLYASFGDNFARAVFQMPNALWCSLPQASVPGTVPVTLRRSPNLNAPVMGTSLCSFEYITDLKEILSIIIRIQEDCTPEVAAALDTLQKEMRNPSLKKNGKPPPRGGEAGHDEIETAIIQALAPLQDTLNFEEVISKTNDYKQTLAHFAVFFGYTNLLRRLVEWNIDLTIADVNGFTALHCAYKEGDKACVDLLLENGASETVLDALGRAPSHLMPEGFASLSDYDADTASDDQPELEQKPDEPSLLQSTDAGDGILDPGDEKSMNETGLADLMHQSQSAGAASNSQSAPGSSPLPVAPAHPPLFPTSSSRRCAISSPPPNLSPPPPPSSSRSHAGSVSSLQHGQGPPMTSVTHPTSTYIPPGVILAVPADNPGGPPILVIPYNPQSSPFVYNHQNERTTMNQYDSPPPSLLYPQHPPLPPDFPTGLSPPPCYSPPPTPSAPLSSRAPFAFSSTRTGHEPMANSSATSDYSATAAPSPGIQQPSVYYFEQDVKVDLATLQSLESFACGGLNGATEEICVLEAQNSEHAVDPQQLDVKATHDPLNHEKPVTVPVSQAPLPLTTALVDTNRDNGTITLPAWLSLVRPQPEDQVIWVRRECQVALDIKFKELLALPGHRPVTQKALLVQSTASVKTVEDYGEDDVLHLSVQVFGADTQSEYKSICNACSKRQGKKKGVPSLVDFYAASNVIKAPDDGLVQVRFGICCYPNHQSPNESAYLLEVALLENQHQGEMFPSQRVVAKCRLPWRFNIGKQQRGQDTPPARADVTSPSRNGAGSNSGQYPMTEPIILSSPKSPEFSEEEYQAFSFVPRSNTQALAAGVRPPQRKRVRAEADLDDEDSQSSTGGRRVRPRLEKWNAAPSTITGPGVTHETIPDGVSSSNGSSNTPASVTPWVSQPDPSLRPVQGHQSSARPVEAATTILRSANPSRGPVSGGIEIWLVVDNLPTTFTLYARFGTHTTATAVQNMHTLSCVLPAASHSGRVRVTLSRSAYPGDPEYGTSLAEFVYQSDHAPLIPILLRMEEKGPPEYTPTIQAIVRMLQEDHAPQDPDTSQAGQIESSLLQALLSLGQGSNFDDIVSTSNDSGQTLVHLSVLFGYAVLLECLVRWRINLAVADISGLTALHCAYLKEDRESIRILLRGGASVSIEDKLGRIPRDLASEGSDLADWLEIGRRGGSPPIEHPMDHEIALGEHFAVLEAEEDHDDDSGYGGSDSGSDVSSNNSEDEEGIDSGSPTLEPGPSTARVSTLGLMNELLTSKKSRKKPRPRLFPDTPHDPAIRTVAKRLQKTEAEPSAIDFLCHGIFPDGTITLEALRAPMTAEEATEFHVEDGTEKYRGLLSREQEVFNCRLCPEGDTLEFKDPEEALHHMTKDHFDMGYSCTCGCNETYWTSLDLKKHKKGKGI